MKTKTLPRQVGLMLALFGLICPGIGFAQTNDSNATTAALLKRVADLERSLAEVKAELAATPANAPAPAPAAAPVPPPVAAPVADAAPVSAPAASDPSSDEDGHTLGPLRFRGYSDFGFGRPLFEKLPQGGVPGSTQSFTLGDFDLFVNANINEHMRVLGEVLVTSDFSNEFGAEIDRLMLTYTFNKYLSVSLGKFNTAIGFYTNEFHRARYFQTATSRPILFADEDNGGILPVHSVGMSATGAIPSGALGLHWVAEVANGRASQNETTVPIQNFVDENNGKATNLALYARPEWIPGFQTGVSFYRDTLHPAGLQAFDQHIYSAHAALVKPHLELIAESVLLQHLSADGRYKFNTTSSYVQASYLMGVVRPYFRYEYQNVPASDPLFASLGRENGPSLGIRFNMNDFSCLKVQYGRLSQRVGATANDVQAQVAIVF